MSDKIGGPAFPFAAYSPAGDILYAPGMTLRDWFAGQVLTAMELQIVIAQPAAAHMAKSAYIVADAMLKKRDK